MQTRKITAKSTFQYSEMDTLLIHNIQLMDMANVSFDVTVAALCSIVGVIDLVNRCCRDGQWKINVKSL